MYDWRKIHMARFEAGINVLQLAKMTGLSPKTIYCAERGKKIRETTMRLIAQALGREVKDFLDDDIMKGA